MVVIVVVGSIAAVTTGFTIAVSVINVSVGVTDTVLVVVEVTAGIGVGVGVGGGGAVPAVYSRFKLASRTLGP